MGWVGIKAIRASEIKLILNLHIPIKNTDHLIDLNYQNKLPGQDYVKCTSGYIF